MSLYFIGEMRREQRFWHLNGARNATGSTERQRNDQSSTDNAAFQALAATLIASRIKCGSALLVATRAYDRTRNIYTHTYAVTRPFCTSTLAGGWANLHSVSGLVHLLRWNSLQTSSCSHRESLPFSRLFMLTIAILPLLEDRESPPSVGLYRERVVTRTLLPLFLSFSLTHSFSLSLSHTHTHSRTLSLSFSPPF
ncbi:hypothetical protein ALC56_05214 [Trachymyrmex septentrionalis]|uniref:Uncharacterized protein n=1 Tax=Trachymyrmex septentrionalis TaxID=34720 RepID=A0A195FJT9_9HYME|nr:hypothetical protein ALC56_05214 [Trachymyrmex septentrionalis]